MKFLKFLIIVIFFSCSSNDTKYVLYDETDTVDVNTIKSSDYVFPWQGKDSTYCYISDTPTTILGNIIAYKTKFQGIDKDYYSIVHKNSIYYCVLNTIPEIYPLFDFSVQIGQYIGKSPYINTILIYKENNNFYFMEVDCICKNDCTSEIVVINPQKGIIDYINYDYFSNNLIKFESYNNIDYTKIKLDSISYIYFRQFRDSICHYNL